jgi:hypothetical protein
LKTQAILQHRSKKERSAAHLSKGTLGPAATFALVRAVNIRVIFDESRASVTSPVPYTKLLSAISVKSQLRRWRPGIKMRFIENGMSVLGQKQTL